MQDSKSSPWVSIANDQVPGQSQLSGCLDLSFRLMPSGINVPLLLFISMKKHSLADKSKEGVAHFWDDELLLKCM